MLSVKTVIVGDLDTNCYLVSHRNHCFIIDPGDSGDFISQIILENKLSPEAIILTHGHFDHVLGCLELVLNFNLPIFINRSDAKLYSKANKSALQWQGRKGDPVPKTLRFVKGGDQIALEDINFKIIATPGHTPGSSCLYYPGIIFTGDTIFADGVGRTDLSYSSPLQLEKSLDKIRALPGNTLLYPGHGPSASVSTAFR